MIPYVERITDEMLGMAKRTVDRYGNRRYEFQSRSPVLQNDAGADMVIINGDDMEHINQLLAGEEIGTLFKAHKTTHFHLKKLFRPIENRERQNESGKD